MQQHEILHGRTQRGVAAMWRQCLSRTNARAAPDSLMLDRSCIPAIVQSVCSDTRPCQISSGNPYHLVNKYGHLHMCKA
jgi:hypothetical protein